MSETLYRKHRPQFFKEIIGQEHIKITLQNEIENNKTDLIRINNFYNIKKFIEVLGL